MTGKVIAVAKQAQAPPIELPAPKAPDVISVSQLAETQEIELPPAEDPKADPKV